MTQRNVRKQGWVFLVFSPDSDDRLNLNFRRFVILYLYIYIVIREVWAFGQHCYRKCPMALKMNSSIQQYDSKMVKTGVTALRRSLNANEKHVNQLITGTCCKYNTSRCERVVRLIPVLDKDTIILN